MTSLSMPALVLRLVIMTSLSMPALVLSACYCARMHAGRWWRWLVVRADGGRMRQVVPDAPSLQVKHDVGASLVKQV